MRRWAGPFACALVFLLLARAVPREAACAVDSVADSAWASVSRIPDLAVSSDLLRASTPATVPDDPFALAPIAEAPRVAAPAKREPGPKRPWKVTGLVGDRAAVLVRPDGSSMVVSVGQRIDSAVVVGISPAGVEIEDRGGRVLLKVR